MRNWELGCCTKRLNLSEGAKEYRDSCVLFRMCVWLLPGQDSPCVALSGRASHEGQRLKFLLRP